MRDSGPKAIKEFSVQHCQKYCCDFKVAENDAEDSMQDQQLMKCCLHMWNAIDSGHIGMAVPKPEPRCKDSTVQTSLIPRSSCVPT